MKEGKPVQNDLDKGSVDFKKTLRSAMDSGNIKYFLVEQEEYPGPVMVSMKNDADYMKALTV